tara:strand:- start:488 stop:790 length:303 start_codon:yes stop_codon:yes gene_type:complete
MLFFLGVVGVMTNAQSKFVPPKQKFATWRDLYNVSTRFATSKKYMGKKNPIEMAEIAQEILGGQYEQQFSGGLRGTFNEYTASNFNSFKNAKTYCLIYDE